MGKICNEAQRLKNEKANEDEQLQLEKQKYSDDSIQSWKYWVKIFGSKLPEYGLLGLKFLMVLKIAHIASDFEATNTWSTSLGKGVGRYVTDSAQSIMRDR